MQELKEIETKTDTVEKLGLFHALTQWAGQSHAGQMIAAELQRDLNRAARFEKREDYFNNLHENCAYCRKRCKLFKPNRCFSKTTQQQMECEHFDKNYVAVRR